MKHLKKFESFNESKNIVEQDPILWNLVPESNLVFESNCDRCGESTSGTIMSIFNEDVICMKCKEDEKKDPEYLAACLAKLEAMRRGDTNFKGAFPDYKPLRRR